MSVRFEAHAEPIAGYRLIERIGSGGFGEVWKCLVPGGVYKAIKLIHGDLRSKDNDLVRYAEQELKSMERVKQVRHPYLLAIDRFDIVEGRLLIVMELADCNLWERFRQYRLKGLPGIPREELLFYMQETCEVLDLMNHQHGLMHLDIKPQNIFLQYNHVKVGDFGQVKDLAGHVAQVTGGITPVYAAPETFDGLITRTCDQYSLACVYQELLTGIRPFDGASMNQLLMQHIGAQPNLQPTPEAERPALARALSKKSEERFPNCREFVQAIRGNKGSRVMPGLPPANALEILSLDAATGSSLVLPVPVEGPPTNTPFPQAMAENEGPTIAPPEQFGPGTLRPTLIVGLGGLGLQVLQRFRKDLNDRYGSSDSVPAVRMLYIDTDPETLTTATTDRPWERAAGLGADRIYCARLNRTAHYMKPRLGGRPMTEGWFDPQLLHRLQRVPTTMGLRAFGRLAFCDHYRGLSQKIRTELELCLAPEALVASVKRTGVAMQTNRPRVYLVTGLTGGTGSGMLIDMAYTIRQNLKKMGYTDPDLVGLLLSPSDDPQETVYPVARANTFAALTELHHYSRPKTQFVGHYDDRPGGMIRETERPFRDVYVLTAPPMTVHTPTPMNAGMMATSLSQRRNSNDSRRTTTDSRRSTSTDHPGSGRSHTPTPRHRNSQLTLADDTITDVVERIRHDLFTTVGRTVDENRVPDLSGAETLRTFGMVRYAWPRGDVVDRTAMVLSGVVVNHWVSPDFSRARQLIPTWVTQQMQASKLTREQVLNELFAGVDKAVGEAMPARLTRWIEPILPRGWLSRLPEPHQLAAVVDQISKEVGVPGGARAGGTVEDAIRNIGTQLAQERVTIVSTALHELANDPRYRLAGTEEAILQLMEYAQGCKAECESEADRVGKEARGWYDRLMTYIHPMPGGKKPTGVELADGLRNFPASQFRSYVLRRTARLFEHLKSHFAELRHEITTCRQRVEALQVTVVRELERPCPAVGNRQLMPVGCATIEDAAQKYLAVLTDDDLLEVEQWIQKGIAEKFGGLYQACLNATDGPEALLRVVREQVRLYLNARLGTVDLAAMFANKFGSQHETVRAFGQSHHDAAPKLIGNGPWANRGLTVLGTPTGPSGEPLREFAYQAFPSRDRPSFAETLDEVIVYREYPYVPFAMLPQFGPAWEAAYQSSPDLLQCSPHTRTDITEWVGVDDE